MYCGAKDQNDLAGGPLPSHSYYFGEPVSLVERNHEAYEPSPSTENEEIYDSYCSFFGSKHRTKRKRGGIGTTGPG